MVVYVDIAQEVHFTGFRRLCDCAFSFREKDADTGEVEDISGWVYEMKIFATGNEAAPLLTINTGNYVSIADNTVDVLIPGADFTIAKGTHQHIIKRTKAAVVEPVMAGRFLVI